MVLQRLLKGFSIDSFYYFAATTVGRNSRNNGCAASAFRRHHHDRRGCFGRWDRRGNEFAHARLPYFGPSANTRHRNIPAYASQVWGHVQLHGLRVDVGAIRRCGMRRAASLRLAGARALSCSSSPPGAPRRQSMHTRMSRMRCNTPLFGGLCGRNRGRGRSSLWRRDRNSQGRTRPRLRIRAQWHRRGRPALGILAGLNASLHVLVHEKALQ